jgi:hypothetical protein
MALNETRCNLGGRMSLGYQLLEAILAPLIDFGLFNPLAVGGLDIQCKLAPTAVEVVRAKKGALS